MKYSRIIYVIAAMLTLPCMNLLAQFKIDSVVFHFHKLDSTKCELTGNTDSHVGEPDDSDFNFITSQVIVSGDSILAIGKGNSIDYYYYYPSRLLLMVDRKANVIKSIHYNESASAGSPVANSIDIENVSSKEWNANQVLINNSDSTPLFTSNYYEKADGSFDYDWTCKSHVNYLDTSNSVTIYGINLAWVSRNVDKLNCIIQPNPSSNIITIKNFQAKNIEILDLLGRKRLTQSPNGMTETSMDVSMLPEGLYWVRVATQTEKLMIVKD